ncbi:DNA polymerase III subunit beta [Nitrosomonas sp. HPC101]|uniref:DNA polymerase III subunit beta n=1 Tax=Nitrosomonas sp. HPC101 TaxID=1658667 RepID=UPI0013710F13|nr:DNA polymerase III subunit beta [Nitrosomonas sp. HPC101]MXS86363.1 DNA polymerase III subunit beta [Nitrosomonas sp. HPC101]
MKLTLSDRDLLFKPLQIVSGIVERRHTLPILLNTLIEISDGKLVLVTTDLEIEIEATSTIPELENQDSLQTTVSVRKLQDILRALPSGSPVELIRSESRLQITSGKSRFSLQLLPAKDFPRMAKDDEPCSAAFTLTQQVLKKHLQRVAHAMAQQDLRYYLNGMLLLIEADRLTMVATDTHRLGITSVGLNEPLEKLETIVPRKTVLELIRQLEDSDKPVTIEIYPKKICFRFSEAVLVSKVISGKFIDFRRAVPQASVFQFDINRLDFFHALQRTAIISSSNDLFRNVHLNITNGKLNISAKNKEQEEAQEEIEIVYSNETIDTSFNIVYLMEVLNNLDSEHVKCSFESMQSAILITLPDDDWFKHILMPMRE